jgi:fermentation-respiration switch protein FrsA (DUF1100 family)
MRRLLLYPIAVLVIGAFASAAWLTDRYYEPYVFTSHITAGATESRLERSTAPPSRKPVRYTIEGRSGSGNLYLPGEGPPAAAIVLVPGAVPEGKDDQRLVKFAEGLARLQFAVLTPELRDYRELEIRTRQVTEVADAFRYLVNQPDLSRGGRAGIGAFSFGAGPAILAALEEDLRQRVRFIFAVGAYHDLRRTIRYFTTGYFETAGRAQHLEPSDYARLVFAYTALDHVSDPDDRATLKAMLDAKVASPGTDISGLASGLGPEGQSVYRLLSNTDPDAVYELIDSLPQETRTLIDALTLTDKALRGLPARLILVHGKNDPLIPYSETLALREAVAPSEPRVFLIERLLAHVDLRFSDVLTARFWSDDLPDAKRVLDSLAALLDERDEHGDDE